MKKFENYLIGGLIVAVFFLGYLAFISKDSNISNNNLRGVNPYSERIVITEQTDAAPYSNHLTASSTQTNLVHIGTATSSYAINTEGASQLNLKLFFLMGTTTSLTAYYGTPASGTTSDTILPLSWYLETRENDDSPWYRMSISSTTISNISSSLIGYSSERNLFTITPIVNSTTTLDISILNTNSKQTRFNFASPNSTSTRIDLWAEAILQKGN